LWSRFSGVVKVLYGYGIWLVNYLHLQLQHGDARRNVDQSWWSTDTPPLPESVHAPCTSSVYVVACRIISLRSPRLPHGHAFAYGEHNTHRLQYISTHAMLVQRLRTQWNPQLRHIEHFLSSCKRLVSRNSLRGLTCLQNDL